MMNLTRSLAAGVCVLLANPPARAAAVASQAPDASVERVLLNAVVFVTSPNEVRGEGWQGEVAGIDVSRLPPLRREAFKAAASSFVGRPIDGQLALELQTSLSQLVKDSDQPFATVLLPPQTVRNGIVQVALIDGRLSQVVVDGVSESRAKRYRQGLSLPIGRPIEKAALDADLAWINRNPFRSATAVAAPGGPFGTVDLQLKVDERRPWSLSANLDDSGTATTDPLRIGAGITWGNAFGRGDILSYNLSATPDFERTVGHALSLQSFLPWRHVLSLSANYSEIEGKVPAPFTLDGYSLGLTGNYEVPLPRDQAIVFGLEFKQSNNNFRFSDLPVNQNTTDVAQVSAGWTGQFEDTRGGTALGFNVALSPGGLTGRNDDVTFRRSRLGADATYAALRFSLDRQTRLPGGLSLANALRGQVATTALLGSEQLTIGGWSSVRGYDEGRFYGDRGAVLRNELNFPLLKGKSVQARPYLFLDAAVFGTRSRQPGEKRWNNVQTVGAGVELSLARALSLRASYGRQIGDQLADGESGRGHVGIAAAF